MRYTIKEKKSLPKSGFFLLIEIPAEEIAAKRAKVLSRAGENAELPGFRKGHIPENILREKMGELALWEEASEDALGEALAEILEVEKLDVIGRPSVQATKLAPENPAEFRVSLSLFPRLSFPDYKKIASEQNKKPEEAQKVEEKEIDAVLTEIAKEHERATGKKDFKLTDETVKELGKFEFLRDIRTKVNEGLLERKKHSSKEKRRATLLDAIVTKTEGELPDVLIEHELDRMEAELKGNVEQFGGTFETYLKEIKKDGETLRKEWSKDAEKRARRNILLSEIARAEKLVVDKDEVEKEVGHILKHYKGANPESARVFVEHMLLNQKTIEFLENQK